MLNFIFPNIFVIDGKIINFLFINYHNSDFYLMEQTKIPFLSGDNYAKNDYYNIF